MARTKRPYTPEFRRQMIELVRAGRSPEDAPTFSRSANRTVTSDIWSDKPPPPAAAAGKLLAGPDLDVDLDKLRETESQSMLLNYWIWPALALMFIAGCYLTRALRSRESQRRIATALGGAVLALVAGLLAFEIYRIIYHVVAPHLTNPAPFSDHDTTPSGR